MSKKSFQNCIDNFSRHKTAVLLTLIYAALISFVSAHHEIWRDEVVVFSEAIECGPLTNVFKNLRNYGHPYLWYGVLYLTFQIFHTFTALKILHISLAVSAIYIFLSKAPFRWFEKILFVLGYYPFYEYAVINRDYVLGMLFLFLLCSLYSQRFKKGILFGVVLFFLANTVVHTLIIAFSVTLSWIAEYIYSFRKDHEEKSIFSRSCKIGISIAIIGMILSVVSMWPDKTATQAAGMYQSNPADMFAMGLRSIADLLVSPGKAFSVFGIKNVFFTSCILWVLYIYLLRKPFIFTGFFLSVIGLHLFFSLICPGATRHLGILYLLVISALWMDGAEKNPEKNLYRLPGNMSLYIPYFLFVLLAGIQLLAAYPAVKQDIREDYSSSKRFGSFMKAHSELKNAIIMSEPDIFAEALPYYIDNQIYIPREKRFGRATRFTTENEQNYSLGRLLNTAKKLRAAYHQPIIILIGHPLDPEGPFVIPVVFQRRFTYSKDSLRSFLKHTRKIAGFHDAYKTENYDVFLLK